MHASSTLIRVGSAAVLLLLAGCNAYVQTTSGKDYLSAFPATGVSANEQDFSRMLRQTAAVEPLLRFPARVGLARIGHDRGRVALLRPSTEDAEAWVALKDELGPDFGEFVPISPLIAALVSEGQQGTDSNGAVRDTVNSIRLAAARQHVDAVLIYEVDATSDTRRNPLSIANWTIIGAFVVPSRNVKAEGVAQALLIDVRNGYPYGTLQANATDKTLTSVFQSQSTSDDLSKRVEIAAVQNLTHEARGLMRELKVKLAALDKPAKAN